MSIKREMVAGLVISDKKLLLVHNSKYGLRIEPPGGKIKPFETIRNSLLREMKEEMNILVRPIKKFGVFDTASPEGNFSVHMFLCDIVGGIPKINEPNKVSGFGWYNFDELLDLEKDGFLVPNMCRALPKLGSYLK